MDTSNNLKKLLNIVENVDSTKMMLDLLSSISISNNFDKIEVDVKPIYDVINNIVIANVLYIYHNVYIIYGPTPISSDGEYKGYITNINQFCYDNFADYSEDLEVAAQLYDNLKIISPIDKSDVIKVLLKTLYLLKTYVMYPQNCNQEFKHIFTPYLNKIKGSPSNLIFQLHMMMYNKTEANLLVTYTTNIGCKIIPLSYYDIKNLDKKTLSFNTEIMINKLISQFINNGICFNFSLMYQYYYFKSSEHIFNNTDINKKKNNGELSTYKIMIDRYKNLESNDVKYKYKLKQLITFAEKKLIYSDFNCLLLAKNTGETLLYYLYNNNEFINNLVVCKSLIFQILYVFMCLHEKLNIIHGDIHLNNITVNNGDNYNLLYKIGDKKYTFKGTYFISLIDYGRAVLFPKYFDNDIDISKNNIQKLLNYFNKIMPEYYEENLNKIKNLISTNTNAMFKVLSVLDIIYFLNNYREFKIYTISTNCLEYIQEIYNTAVKYLRNNIENNLNNQRNISDILIEKFYVENYEDIVYSYINNYNNTIGINTLIPIIDNDKTKQIKKIQKYMNFKIEKDGLNFN